MDYNIITCPLVEDKISVDDGMENRETRDEAVPARFKVKPECRKNCEKCGYFKY